MRKCAFLNACVRGVLANFVRIDATRLIVAGSRCSTMSAYTMLTTTTTLPDMGGSVAQYIYAVPGQSNLCSGMASGNATGNAWPLNRGHGLET